MPAAAPAPLARLQRVTGADQAEHVTAGGRTGVAELQVTGLDSAFHDLAQLRDRIGQAVVPVLRTTPMEDGTSVTLTVPETLPCGRHPVSLEWNGGPASDAVEVTMWPFIRGAPAVLAVTDGIDLLSRTIFCGVAKLWIRDLTDPAALRASIGGRPVSAIDLHCEDKVDQRYQVNIAIPAGLPAGRHRFDVTVAEAAVFSEPNDIQPHASG